jgi:hydroxylamine dehydrogenase
MKKFMFFLLMILLSTPVTLEATDTISEDTKACLECHAAAHPGILADWQKSRMTEITPAEAMKKAELERRISVKKLPDELAGHVVGCAECHTINPEKHPDTFDHEGYQVHTVVTPRDCATCHPVEVSQFGKNIMSHAHLNLNNNSVYLNMMEIINGEQGFEGGSITYQKPDAVTNEDSCNYCHGTKVEVQGVKTKDTDFGELSFPVLTGWPNQGVGRINPDESLGSCSACHARHHFSIEMARKPHTCSECHKGPDVPAYKVYQVSKHGNIYSSLGKDWEFDPVPWVVGKDFTAPTCATCHVSLVTTEDGEVVAERTHQMNNRLAWRIFGLIYAHPHPKSPLTTIIKNKDGLPLPTELTGEPMATYLIDAEEQAVRRKTMETVCLSCHSHGWVQGHFSRYENTINITNNMTLTATEILLSAWEKGAAKGLSANDSIFNEAIEKKWVEQWLFFANSTRYSSAMAGADYGVFANGRWYMSRNIQEMIDWLQFKLDEKN